ncbi:hypothetical protein GIB67_034040 [Kingdonia uniflora]|uniref:Glutathione S-transferase n=1 Tax=Kingdonia uniflora TaxID=39325 RepID=A0A7J7M617_9MAGN|nr:hypothetical protein GIB67_034040 [Kingdonia uniflora]
MFQEDPCVGSWWKLIVESSIILEYIEETWLQKPLLPADPYEKAVARFWSKFVDDKSPRLYGFFMKVGEEQEKAVQEGLEIL